MPIKTITIDTDKQCVVDKIPSKDALHRGQEAMLNYFLPKGKYRGSYVPPSIMLLAQIYKAMLSAAPPVEDVMPIKMEDSIETDTKNISKITIGDLNITNCGNEYWPVYVKITNTEGDISITVKQMLSKKHVAELIDALTEMHKHLPEITPCP